MKRPENDEECILLGIRAGCLTAQIGMCCEFDTLDFEEMLTYEDRAIYPKTLKWGLFVLEKQKPVKKRVEAVVRFLDPTIPSISGPWTIAILTWDPDFDSAPKFDHSIGRPVWNLIPKNHGNLNNVKNLGSVWKASTPEEDPFI